MTRTVLVTGANRGIGRAIAEVLVESGLQVVAAARRAADAEMVAAELGVAVTPLELDLSDPARAGDRVRVLADERPIDALVNNAGVLPEGRGAEPAVDDVARAFDVNALAAYALIRAVLPGMMERGYGRVVNVSSGWGSFAEGLTGPSAYAISKAALNAITLAVAQGVPRGVKVNACCPGWVRTRMGGPSATRSPRAAADTPVWLATLDEGGPNGGFFRDRKPIDW